MPTLSSIPVMPLRDLVVFPNTKINLFIGRPLSLEAVKASITQHGGRIILLAQHDSEDETPDTGDIHRVGVVGEIVQVLQLPDGTERISVMARARVRVSDIRLAGPLMEADAEPLEETESPADEVSRLWWAIAERLRTPVMAGMVNREMLSALTSNSFSPEVFGLVGGIHLPIAAKQEMLEASSIAERLSILETRLSEAITRAETEQSIEEGVKSQITQAQRKHFLQEQMKQIQKQLEENGEEVSEIDALAERIAKKDLPEEARKRVDTEFKRLRSLSPAAPEAGIIRNYIDWILELPWTAPGNAALDVQAARDTLDAGHYGLGKVKERIIEQIVVQSRSEKVRGPVLCLIGPPGVGKTSLGKSMAAAMGREFVRVPLGGVRDETEIRGHRRTYVGAMPGKIIAALRKCGSNNPVIMLDEIDKISRSNFGDPSAALLEVLDPEQNGAFQDHFLDLGYDLSKVLFLTTANEYRMSQPLADRMEIIELSGYTEDEKLRIARSHLIPKQMAENAATENDVRVSDEAVMLAIRHYTRESGVRNLERVVGALIRKALTEAMTDGKRPVDVTAQKAETYLGVRTFDFGVSEDADHVGMVNGLAWSQAGGSLLQIEALRMPGKGKVSGTGMLGDVMKESIEAAASFVRSSAHEFGIDPKAFSETDVHVHALAGSTPKDGPSAGLAIVTAIVSALTGNPVRRDVAMTGEVSLRGNALPIGGLKEKLLAAQRGGVRTVFIPKKNEKDLAELPDSVRRDLRIVPVSNVREVLAGALADTLTPWTVAPAHAEVCSERAH